MDMLILRLRAPLVSFGGMAVDELRPTDPFPTLSQISGMIANALGWTFQDSDKIQRLQARLRIAFRADKKGELLRDYQTARLNSDDKLWRTDGAPAEREGGFSGDFTVQRERFYRSDAAFTALAALTSPEEFPTLADIAQALRHPARPLFIGRVSCPPSEPICWEEDGRVIISEESFEKAFERIPLRPSAPWGNSASQKANFEREAEWPVTPQEAQEKSGNEDAHVFERCDVRAWTKNVHGGQRFVYRGSVRICADTSRKGESR